MVEYIDIDCVKPAEYNPRKISKTQIETLKKSFNEIGFIIPILVNKKNNVIIAGHQRSKTAKMCNIKKIPAMYVDNLVFGDEIKFNQLHNALDKSLNNSPLLFAEHKKEMFIQIDNKEFENKQANANATKEICKLLIKYGNVLTCIICRQKVLYGCEYVKACKLLNLKVNAYICDDDKYDKVLYYINQEYGKYSYDNIKRNTFVQGLAQMNRNVKKIEGKKQNASMLYEKMVLPYLQQQPKNISVLDFGCGKGAYVKELINKKYNAIGVEFYNHNNVSINISKGNKQIDNLIEYLKQHKTFDVVVCDSVLNSVDSVEAEKCVMLCLNLFANKKLFISGRQKEFVENRYESKKSSDAQHNYFYYCDENNFTADYREGKWYFQKFHTKQQALALMKKYGFNPIKFIKTSSSWQIECEKVKTFSQDEYIKAIDFEFNLPLPNGRTYNRQDDIKKAIGFYEDN